MTEDGTGAIRLRAWIDGVRAIPAGGPTEEVLQRLVYPGVSEISGNGLLSVTPLGEVPQIGEGPQSAAYVRFVKVPADDMAENNERDALLGALLTVASDRRCQIVPELVAGLGGTNDALFLPMNTQVDPTLTAPMPAWNRISADLRDMTARLASMDLADAEAIMSAIHMHYSSALLFARDVAGAYALAVGGVETLAARFGTTPSDWIDWDRAASWDKFFVKTELSEVQAQAFRKRILAENHVRLTERFAAYLCDRLPKKFWREEVRGYTWGFDSLVGHPIEGAWFSMGPRSKQFFSDPAALRKAVRATYRRRSLYVHSGQQTGDHASEWFGDGPGRTRNSLSYAQLRSALRRLIIVELSNRGSTAFPDMEKFVAQNFPERSGRSFFRSPS